MKRLFNETLGFYYPSFFFMQLNTSEKLDDLNNLSENTKATLMHEYLHFLQDITTTYGLINICHIVDIIKEFCNVILKKLDKNFYIPVKIPCNPAVNINIDLMSLYQGDIEYNKDFSGISSIRVIKNGLIPGYEDKKMVQIESLDQCRNINGTFNFGSHCIIESMAHLVQCEFFNNVNHPKFPYRSVEYLTDHIFPEIGENKINLIGLCDISLNTTHPGLFFYDLLTRMKKINFEPSHPSKIYEFVIEDFKLIDCNGEFTIQEIFNKYSSLAINQISDYFNKDNFQPVLKWAKNVIETGQNIRSGKFDYLTQIMTLSKCDRESKFSELLYLTGIPLTSNCKDEFYFYHPTLDPGNQIAIFRAIYEIYSILKGNQESKSKCNLKNFCKQHPEKDFTSDICDIAPWKNTEEEFLCPFAQVWKMWGLMGKEPIFNYNKLKSGRLENINIIE